ncbi:hypothetical protein JCM10213_007772 [Rhodosporidiobolus nylandii]
MPRPDDRDDDRARPRGPPESRSRRSSSTSVNFDPHGADRSSRRSSVSHSRSPRRPSPPRRALVALGCKGVVGFEQFLEDASRTRAADEVLVWFKAAAISIPVLKGKQPGHLSPPDHFRLLSPDLTDIDRAFVRSARLPFTVDAEEVDLPPTTHLNIDGVPGVVSEISSSGSGGSKIAKTMYSLSAGNSKPVRLYARNLLLRPVFQRDDRGRLDVHFQLKAAAMYSKTKLCEMGGLEKLA